MRVSTALGGPALGILCALSLSGCREEPGRCSANLSTLCLEVDQGSSPLPDSLALTVNTQLGDTRLTDSFTSGVAQAFADRQHYTIEIDPAPVPDSQTFTFTVSAMQGGTLVATAGGSWNRDDKIRPLVVQLQSLGQHDASPGGGDMASSPTFHTGLAAAATLGAGIAMFHPIDLCWTGSRLYVSDLDNNKIVYFDGLQQSMPTGNFAGPNSPSPSAGTLSGPRGLWCNTDALFVADSGNNRVLGYAPLPGAGSSAAGVAGQMNATLGAANRGTPTQPHYNTLSGPHGVFWDGQRLYIADTGNSRVVIYPLAQLTAGALAGLSSPSMTAVQVLGQASLDAQGSASGASGLSGPEAVYVQASRVAVADGNNNRVPVFDLPVGLTGPANAVLGQTGLSAGMTMSGISAASLYAPSAVRALGAQVVVADRLNSRVLLFTGGLPTAQAGSGAPAQAALGQPVADSVAFCTGGGMRTQMDQLCRPSGAILVTDANGPALVVADTENRRVQVFRPAL